ncbi:YtzH-like family protein [Cytobacillus sp. IB215665]|uniref:YtzH-like family protein n=1 Tax=Cytobacillus sp. IB215665 TaxID=3097357 RepID=UPI002A1746C2|nr:YtzH-like family protein [Cytobacillus sp. IB215665]MDX8367478.1 YtzH-like family protein [Cytobacillus sp. IB215665]
MPLDQNHQINLLKDILENHLSDCCGTVSECEQVERLVKSLMNSSNSQLELNNTFENIYNYSQSGKNSQNLENHISTHQQELSQWVDDITQLT